MGENKDSKISRREFLHYLSGAFAWFVPEIGKRDNQEPKSLPTKESIFRLPVIENSYLPKRSDIVIDEGEFFEQFSQFLRDKDPTTKFKYLQQIAISLIKSSDKITLLKVFTKLEIDAIFANKDPILFSLQHASSADELPSPLKETISRLVDSGAVSIAAISKQADKVKKSFEKVPGANRQILFTVSENEPNLLSAQGYFKEPFPYQSRMDLDRYDKTDKQSNFEILPEVQKLLQDAEEIYGIPGSIIAAILIAEGGGGKVSPGLTLSKSSQAYSIAHDFNIQEYLINAESGAAGVAQMMPDTRGHFAQSPRLIWQDEVDPQQQNNIKTGIGLIAAKLYADTIMLRGCEKFRYRKEYEKKRLAEKDRVYSIISSNMNVASDESGMQRLLNTEGKLGTEDILYILNATAFYFGDNSQKFPRLGDRSYDEFAAAYYLGSLEEKSNRIDNPANLL